MPIAVLQEKLQTLPESCFAELFEFMEFLEYKNSHQSKLPPALPVVIY